MKKTTDKQRKKESWRILQWERNHWTREELTTPRQPSTTGTWGKQGPGKSVLLQTFTLTSLILYLKLTASPSEFSEVEKVVNWGNDYSSLPRLAQAAAFQPCFRSSAGASWLSSPSHMRLSSAPAHSHLTPMLIKTEMASESPIACVSFLRTAVLYFLHVTWNLPLVRWDYFANHGQMLPVHLGTLPPKHASKD